MSHITARARERWTWKHRPWWARYIAAAMWKRLIRVKAAYLPWTFAYRYRVSRGWPRPSEKEKP